MIFDRLVEFDDRSREFPIRTLVGDKPRRSYTWRVGVSLDQGNEGACFPAGTLVRLADGSHVPIEEVRTLDEVVTAEGRVGRVLQTMARQADELVSVRVDGHWPVRCTPNHPILTRRGYIAAQDLTLDDVVAVTRYSAEEEQPLELNDLFNLQASRAVVEGTVLMGGLPVRITKLPELLPRTPALGRLLGLYAAEGHCSRQKVVWSYGGHEVDTLVPETMELIKTVFGAEAGVQHRPNGSFNVNLYGVHWSLLFSTLVPGTAKRGDKHLTGFVTQGPRVYREALLGGWLSGDGHIRRTSAEGVSVCRRMALDFHALATELGQATLSSTAPSMNRHAKTRQRRYSVTRPLGGGSNRSSVIDDWAIWRKVREVTTEPFNGWVYNFHVEGDESYVADGLGVHNCVGFGWAHELAARPSVRPATNALAFQLYYEAQRLDPWPGEAYSGTSVLAGAKAVQAHGWLSEYRWAFGEDDLALAVGYRGPAVLGANWRTGMDDLLQDSAGRLWASVSGDIRGGHCFITHGYSIPLDAYKCWNSWGAPSEFYISRTDMVKLLADEGEACIPLKRL